MTDSIKLNLDIQSEDFLKILENLEPAKTSIWDGRLVTDQMTMKNYSYENLLRIFNQMQENLEEDPEKIEQMRSRLLDLNTCEDTGYLSLDNAKNVFHSLISYVKGESIDPDDILYGPALSDEEIKLDEEVNSGEEVQTVEELDSNNSSQPLSPRWIFLAGVAGGIALSVLLYSAHSYLTQPTIPCTPPYYLNDEHKATYCRVAATSTDKKVLYVVEQILWDLQCSQEKISQLQKDLKITKDLQIAYNTPEIHAKIKDWLYDPVHKQSAIDLLLAMAKHNASTLSSINLVKKGILEYSQSDNSTIQLKAIKALFSLYARDDYQRDTSLIFENVFQDPSKLHKENLAELKGLIRNSNVDINDFKFFFSALNHTPPSQFSREHADFSDFLLKEHFINKRDITSPLAVVETLMYHGRTARAYTLLQGIVSGQLNDAQNDQATAVVQKMINNSYLQPYDLNHLLPIVNKINPKDTLTVPTRTIQAITQDGSLENCYKLSEFLMRINKNQVHDFAKMLLMKKTYSILWGTYATEEDKQKQQAGLDLTYYLENPGFFSKLFG